MLPQNILTAIEEALESVDKDISDRVTKGEGYKDLDRIKDELLQMKLEKRKEASDALGRIIVDSMDWNQPCLKKFNEVIKLLRSHYSLRP
jgi:hypothetical protein